MCRLGSMGAGHFPVVLAILMVFMLALTYALAVYRDDVDPFFPYISATGSKRPESCIFGQIITFIAFIALIIVYLRYRLVKELNRGMDRILRNLNLSAFVLGVLSTLGMTLVGNFQESAVISVHLLGAFMCFGFGVIYSILHSIITHRMCPLYCGRRIGVIRTFFSAVTTIAFIIAVSAGVAAGWQYHKATGNMPDHFFFKKGEPGYTAHVVSAIHEWVLTIFFGFFLLSFSRDFEKLRVGVGVEPLVQHLDETPVMNSLETSDIPVIST